MKYAIVASGGKQYRAVEGETMTVDRLPVEPGTSVKLEQVLLVADGETIVVGTPVVKDNPVWTKALEHFKGPKVVTFNYHSKKRIRVKSGHRQDYTHLLVEQIGGAQPAPKKEETKKVAARKTAKKAEVKETEAVVEAVVAEKKPARTAKKETKAAPKETEAKKATKAPAEKPAAKAKKPATKTSTEKKTTTKPSSSKTTKAPAKKAAK